MPMHPSCRITYKCHRSIYVYSNQTDCFTPCQNDRDNHLKMEVWWENIIYLFIYISLWWIWPALWLGLIMRIWSVMIVQELSQALFTNFANLHSPYVQVVKMCRVRWLEKAECVWQPPRCLHCALCYWQHSRVQYSHFTHKNYMKSKMQDLTPDNNLFKYLFKDVKVKSGSDSDPTTSPGIHQANIWVMSCDSQILSAERGVIQHQWHQALTPVWMWTSANLACVH